jgi:hypothetical protein
MRTDEQWANCTVEEFCEIVSETHEDRPCLECYSRFLCNPEWYKNNKDIKLKDVKED